jgi:hypothetical protein
VYLRDETSEISSPITHQQVLAAPFTVALGCGISAYMVQKLVQGQHIIRQYTKRFRWRCMEVNLEQTPAGN